MKNVENVEAVESLEVSQEVKIVIIKNNIVRVNQEIYDKTIACEAGTLAKNKDKVAMAEAALEILLKEKRGYEKILKREQPELKTKDKKIKA